MPLQSEVWALDPDVVFLNHGSFGACPRAVLDEQQRWRAEMERQPVDFLVRRLEPLLDEARGALAAFVGADGDDLVFVANATTGVNAVLRSLRFEPGDELLVTDHAYNACRNALDLAAECSGARVVVAQVPFPLEGADQVVEAVLACASARTRLALLDHVTSPTAVIFPIAELVARLAERGVDTLVDGAHAPGMLSLDVKAIGAAYYTGNCHKWICAPKGAGFLWVRRDRQSLVHPVVTSHGRNAQRPERSRFLLEFDWVGTHDPSPYLCVPAALRFLGSLLPGGWPELRARNRALALEARRLVCGALGVQPPCPEEMLGAMATVALPDGPPEPPRSALYTDPSQKLLLERHRIEIPIFPWPAPPKRWVRLSAQLYNSPEQYRHLARALAELAGGCGNHPG